MSKVKIRVSLGVLILQAAVALFLSSGLAGSFLGSNPAPATLPANNAVVLTADGGDPQPPPTPIPWPWNQA
jgi:hypothetical protein